MNLRVLAINVWNVAGDSHRTELLNREIRKLAPDLVACEEVIQTPERHQLEELLASTEPLMPTRLGTITFDCSDAQ